MLRTVVDARAPLGLLAAAVVCTWGLRTYPLDADDPYLAFIHVQKPGIFCLLVYGYATLWFTTPWIATSVITSVLAMVAYRRRETARMHPLAAYPAPETRPTPTLVLGESHFPRRRGRAPEPTWLTIPQRGLYTGVLVLGAVGTGKTSGCMYPYVDQLLRWRADDPQRKIGGLVLEVKGDFCHKVRVMLTGAHREADYLELGLDTGFCYNPLHNDLDPYAVAYAVASLLNNLYGKSKEPFWQQAYTDLLKFIISLRRITTGYTTLSEVYQFILDESRIGENISQLQVEFKHPRDVIAIAYQDYEIDDIRQAPWTLWAPFDENHIAHPYDADLDG